jgi:hypothetical protein
MSLKDIDLTAALHRLADRKIEQAIQEGKFDRIEGMGQPLDLEPLPADENARMQWWALKILRQNDVTPDEVRWRKQVDGLRDELAKATTEPRVRQVVAAINQLVKRLNTLGTNALNTPMGLVSVEDELAKLRGRQATAAIAGGGGGTGVAAPAATPVAAAAAASRADPPAGHRSTGGHGPTIRTCGNAQCRSRNPGRAKFCRRCGGRL